MENLHDQKARSRLLTVAQMAELPEYRHAFPVSSLRHLIFQAEDRKDSKGGTICGNGLAEAGAIIRLGRKVLIDVDRFDRWLDAHRTVNPSHPGGG